MAQDHLARDFFFPTDTVNKAFYIDPESRFNSRLHYHQSNDTLYTIKYSFSNNDQIGMAISAHIADGPVVRIIWEIVRNVYDNKYYYKRNNTYFKLPLGSEPESWYYINGKRERVVCTAKYGWQVVKNDTIKAVSIKKAITNRKKEVVREWTEHYGLYRGYLGKDAKGPGEFLHEEMFSSYDSLSVSSVVSYNAQLMINLSKGQK